MTQYICPLKEQSCLIPKLFPKGKSTSATNVRKCAELTVDVTLKNQNYVRKTARKAFTNSLSPLRPKITIFPSLLCG